MAVVSMNYLLESGAHFGHQTKRWDPKMKEYIFGSRDGIYIIDLQKTLVKIEEAYTALSEIAKEQGKVLFVGTKKQAQEAALEAAERCGQFYINERWLGGTLTNFATIRTRIKRMEEIEKMETEGTFKLLPKAEVQKLKKEYNKLCKNLSGIREMYKLPKALIVADPKKEETAILEARKLKIPVFGIIDTNCNPEEVDFPIPANDDAIRAVKLIFGVLANAVCEANGGELVDYVSETERQENRYKKSPRRDNRRDSEREVRKEVKAEVKKEEKKEVKSEVKKEVKKEETSKVDYTSMKLTELKEAAKEAKIKGYSTMKKAELVEALNKGE